MTKKELIRELETEGCFDANMSWTKTDLETQLAAIRNAKKMSLAELYYHTMKNKEEK